MKRLAILLLSAGWLLSAPGVQAGLPDPVRFSVRLEVGDLAQAKQWLDEGLDPDFEGALIGTGLMIGAWEGNIPLMELFLERGADLHRVNRFGETALMLAAWKNHAEALRWLLEKGARPNRGARQWTALHYAAFAGHAALIDDLLAAAADVNARSTNGSTVLMMAAREGHDDLAKRLLAAGANPALKNDFGDDAVAWAMRQGNYEIAKAIAGTTNFAALARAEAGRPPPQRSIPIPDQAEEYLRMARLAEARGQRGEALAAYRKAYTELKVQEAKKKVGAGDTAKNGKTPQSVVIKARRGAPEQQSLSFGYGGREGAAASAADTLLGQARAAEAAGRRQEALRLYQEAARAIRAEMARR